MFKKDIEYTDYNGNKRKEAFYFNLSKAELMEMELSTSGGFQQYINRIINAQDTPQLVKLFKELILKSYGEKSDDGKRFIKSDEIRDAFSQTEAYSELFMELATNTEAATEFVNHVIPSDMAEKVEELRKGGELIDKDGKVIPMT
jgi:hypothetical protein